MKIYLQPLPLISEQMGYPKSLQTGCEFNKVVECAKILNIRLVKLNKKNPLPNYWGSNQFMTLCYISMDKCKLIRLILTRNDTFFFISFRLAQITHQEKISLHCASKLLAKSGTNFLLSIIFLVTTP